MSLSDLIPRKSAAEPKEQPVLIRPDGFCSQQRFCSKHQEWYVRHSHSQNSSFASGRCESCARDAQAHADADAWLSTPAERARTLSEVAEALRAVDPEIQALADTRTDARMKSARAEIRDVEEGALRYEREGQIKAAVENRKRQEFVARAKC